MFFLLIGFSRMNVISNQYSIVILKDIWSYKLKNIFLKDYSIYFRFFFFSCPGGIWCHSSWKTVQKHKQHWHFWPFLSYCPEKAMAPHSSTLAWKIPWTEEPGRLQSMGLLRVGSLRVGHDWATSFSLFTFMHWRRKWQPTPVFLPGESQGRGSLVGCPLWGRTESDTTDAT